VQKWQKVMWKMGQNQSETSEYTAHFTGVVALKFLTTILYSFSSLLSNALILLLQLRIG